LLKPHAREALYAWFDDLSGTAFPSEGLAAVKSCVSVDDIYEGANQLTTGGGGGAERRPQQPGR
jgi:hypothetical protein